jgi:hypothetical protein
MTVTHLPTRSAPPSDGGIAAPQAAVPPAEAGPETALRRARVFWWWVLGVSAAISVVGNGLRAWLVVDAHGAATVHPQSGVTVNLLPPVVAAILAALVPVGSLVHTHGLALLIVAPSRHGRWSKLVVFVVIGLLAAGSFYLSFDALRQLAMQAGFSAHQSWVFPPIIDGSIGGATAVLLSLPASAAEVARQKFGAVSPPVDEQEVVGEGAAAILQDDAPAVKPPVLAMPVRREVVPATTVARRAPRSGTVTNGALALTAVGSGSPTRDWSEIAERMAAGPVRRDSEKLKRLLYLAFDLHGSAGEIAAEIGWKAGTVQRLIDDAQPYLMAAQSTG